MIAPPDRGSMFRIHGTCVLVGPGAVLLRGPSGSGKSRLAFELLSRDGPARAVRLIADDAVDLMAAGSCLLALAPPATAGLIELRGVGLVPVPREKRAVISLIVDLVIGQEPDRLPDAGAARIELGGIDLPRIVLPGGDRASALSVLAAHEILVAGGTLPALPDRAS
jgi:HPr kinase/phosphorylase